MKRREFIKVVAGSVAGWPLEVCAQQPAMHRKPIAQGEHDLSLNKV